MSTQPLPLSILCDVSVFVTPQGATTPTFNQGLIVGNSGRIPSVGAGSRCLLFASVAAMISYGFQANDPEVIAAGLYFGQTPEAVYLWVGCQDATALAAVNIHAGSAGAGYTLNDIVTVTHAGAQLGKVKITAIAGGIPSAVQLIEGSQGTGYAVSNANPTTGGSGAGLQIDITAIGETPLEAVTACRIAQPAWYLAMVTTAVDADALAIAAYAQTAVPQMQLVYSTSSASALNGTTGNIFSLLKAANYSRAHGVYSTTQGGASPNNAYFAAAVMGRAMGLNTGLDNSNFTLAGKNMVGVTVEPLSLAQINVFSGTPGLGTGNNGNVYANYANVYSIYQQGVNANGNWFDDILGLDMLAADCQISVLNVYTALASIPQTDAGQSLVLNAVQAACARSAARGFLAGGVWSGPTVLKVVPGTSLPTGYLAQSVSFQTQSPTDKALRKGMPVYVTVIRAGSQQSFTIGINVQ